MTIESPPRQVGSGSSIFFMDVIRGVASQLVVLGHSLNVFLPSLFMMPAAGGGLVVRSDGIFMQNLAVLIFFYISGYLITASFLKKSRAPEWRFRHFMADRAARIFTPLLPLLLILFISDNLVFGDGAVTPYSAIDAGLDDLVRNATMLFDNPLLNRLVRLTDVHWLSGPAFGTANQLWTVAIEWWIYVLFGLTAFALIRRRGNAILWAGLFCFALAVTAAQMPNKSGLILAWLVGMGFRLGHDRLKAMPPSLLAGIALASFALAATRWLLTSYDFYDPLTAVLLGIALFAFMLAREGRPAAAIRFAGPIVDGMSKISYSLYLVHLSLIHYAAHWFPGLVGQPAAVPAMFVLCNAAAILFYVLFERHYPWVRRRLQPLLASPAPKVQPS